MNIQESPKTGLTMSDGYTYLHEGDFYRAFLHFKHFADLHPATKDTLPGTHMAGISLRCFGEFEKSVGYLRAAAKQVEDSHDRRLKGVVYRDLGISLLAYALKKRDQATLDEAEVFLSSSKEVLVTARQSFVDGEAQFNVFDFESCLTESYIGLLNFETGDKDYGRDTVDFAHTRIEYLMSQFGSYEYELHEVNTMLLFLRVSSLWERLMHLDRAFELTDKSSQFQRLRRHVWAALFGNQVYKLLTRRVI